MRKNFKLQASRTKICHFVLIRVLFDIGFSVQSKIYTSCAPRKAHHPWWIFKNTPPHPYPPKSPRKSLLHHCIQNANTENTLLSYYAVKLDTPLYDVHTCVSIYIHKGLCVLQSLPQMLIKVIVEGRSNIREIRNACALLRRRRGGLFIFVIRREKREGFH